MSQPTGLFGQPLQLDDDEAALVAAYVEAGTTLDDLPYTEAFAQLHAKVGLGRSQAEVFRRLHNLRKASKLPRLGRAATPAVKVNEEEEALLQRAVLARVRSLGERDSLLFTPEFDAIVEQFCKESGRALTAHDVWRLLAKIAK
jgi:hypothetical protein